MATIKMEIDTVPEAREGVGKSISIERKPFILASRAIFLVSTIKLSRPLKDAFESGVGQPARIFDDIDYDDIKKKIGDLDNPNRLIVTSGGLIAFEAAKEKATRSNFVSLVGHEPTGNIGKCLGGVTLNSFNVNNSRADFLESIGRNRAGIGLFCNLKSKFNPDEEADWATIPGVNHTIAHGGNTANKNDSSHYLNDLTSADAGITTMVISADPFFLKTKEKLIKAANDWVALAAPGTRHVCYPLEDYANADGNNKPTPNTASWYGPNLLDAYRDLGLSAASALTDPNPTGFSNATDTWGRFPPGPSPH